MCPQPWRRGALGVRQGFGGYRRLMIIVTGSVLARPETIDDVTTLSLSHVHRSRQESGCLLHSVHHDVENPLRLMFLEHWRDPESLRVHFNVDASRDFARNLTALAAAPPEISIYDASPVNV
jgi:quinol monooxygenase YgiN